MARVYISCHHPDPANALAAELVADGHTVTSTWHTSTEPRPASDDSLAWTRNADRNLEQIERSDALVVIASPEHISREKCVSGGKFFEAGYAHSVRDEDGNEVVRVFTLGGVENGMLHTSSITHAADVPELLRELKTV